METVIDKIRGILRKEGVTGMDSINHCIVFVIARMLDENKCKKFGIDEKNSYYNIMHDEDGDLIDAQELYGRVYTKNDTTCLVGQISNKLKFSNIKFKLESPQHVEQIMKELEKLDMTKLENKYDIIGTIYEYHLKSGTSNAMRDLGQYYTNRLVIEFMIKLCDIKMNKKGEIETIIDPTMGTGGFLTMAVKYLNDKYKNKIDWAKNKSRIYGFDIDENVKNMALLNMLLECGEMCEDTFIKNDTLYNDFKLKNGDTLEKVDVILANEPMGIKNIIHASCCERIKELKIRGTKAEPLFLQLFMTSLNEGGRCAVIVPDGVLFNDSTLHNDTRKYLVENFNLKKVIGLNDDFFLNTGVKTSILFFAKDGKTVEVEFSELKLNKNEVVENSIIKVDYKKIKEMDYSLFVNKYNCKEITKIEGVKYEKLGDVCELKIGGTPRRDTSKYWDNGTNIWISVSELNNNVITDSKEKITDEGIKNSNVKLIKKNSILMSFKMSVGKKAIAGTDLYTNEAIVAINAKNNNLLNKYIYYAIDNFDFSGACSSIGGGNLNKEKIENLEIPIPSLEVQKKIVEQLDVMDDNIKIYTKQIEETKNKMKNYIDVYIKTNNKSIDDKNKSDEQMNEPDDDNEIDQKPVKKIKTKIVKKVESSSGEESSSSNSSSESEPDEKPKKKLIKKTK
jgi:type I restriction-modification system DNA methylase subunit